MLRQFLCHSLWRCQLVEEGHADVLDHREYIPHHLGRRLLGGRRPFPPAVSNAGEDGQTVAEPSRIGVDRLWDVERADRAHDRERLAAEPEAHRFEPPPEAIDRQRVEIAPLEGDAGEMREEMLPRQLLELAASHARFLQRPRPALAWASVRE
jgi:hypothetical protein